MKQIKTMTRSDVIIRSIDLLSKTYIELGQHNVEEETLEVLAESLTDDLFRFYKNFYFEDAKNAFNLGVRSQISGDFIHLNVCLLYTSPSPRDRQKSRMPSSA